MKSIRSLIHFFLFYCILFFPFGFYTFPYLEKIVNYIYGVFVFPIAEFIFGENAGIGELTSDSKGLHIWIFTLFIFSCTDFILTSKFMKYMEEWRDKLLPGIRVFFVYYLSVVFIKYGFDKIFKGQFYLPEPNILYSPFGYLDKDILYWSTMGVSHSYNIFMGIIEIIPAILLLHKKTRALGLMILIPIILNIIAVNFSYDISVKTFSIFLLCLTLVAASPYFRSMYLFFVKGLQTSIHRENVHFIHNPSLKFGIKFFIIGMFFMEGLSPYVFSGNFNDDTSRRPYLHGAYEFETPADIFPEKGTPFQCKRFSIHRDGYLIFQDTDEKMRDYKLKIDRNNKKILAYDYTSSSSKTAMLQLEYSITKDGFLQIRHGQDTLPPCRILDWRKLPVLQQQFHWQIEDVR